MVCNQKRTKWGGRGRKKGEEGQEVGGTGNSAEEGWLTGSSGQELASLVFQSLLPFRTLSPEKSRGSGGNLLQILSILLFHTLPTVRSRCHNKITNLLNWPGLVIFLSFCHSVSLRAEPSSCLPQGVTGWRPGKEPAAPPYPSFRGFLSCFLFVCLFVLRYTTLGVVVPGTGMRHVPYAVEA